MVTRKARATNFDINITIQVGDEPEHVFKAKGETSEDFIAFAADIIQGILSARQDAPAPDSK